MNPSKFSLALSFVIKLTLLIDSESSSGFVVSCYSALYRDEDYSWGSACLLIGKSYTMHSIIFLMLCSVISESVIPMYNFTSISASLLIILVSFGEFSFSKVTTFGLVMSINFDSSSSARPSSP